MAETKIQTSFAAGELSKNLYARVDLDKFTVGAALLRNFYVDWRGGASNRAGTKYVNKCKVNGARLMPFDFNTEITYMMEFGPQYIRFYTSGQPLLEASQPILGMTSANPGVFFVPLHGWSVGDEIVLSAPNMLDYDKRQLLVGSVVDASHVTFTDLFGNNINTTGVTFAGPVTGSRIYTLASPYLAADLFDLNFTQSADVVTIVHPNYIPYNLSRVTASQFQLVADVIGPVIDPPTALTVSASAAGNNNYGYVVTALNEDGTEESIICVPEVVSSKLLDQTASPPVQIVMHWTAPSQIVSSYNIYKWGPVGKASGAPPTIFGYIGNTKATTFTDANIAADFSKVPPDFQDPFDPGQISGVKVLTGGAYTSGGSVSYVALTIVGDGTGAAGYAVVDYGTGAVVGAFITAPGKGYTTATVTAGAGGATFEAQISPESGTYPSVVSYVQQRRGYAAPNGDPQAVTLSQTGNYNNFNVSPVVADSDAITLRLASTEIDFIQSMTPMSSGLVILTSGGAWLLSGGTPGAPITPSATTATRQASHGANRLPPIVRNYNVLYMQQKGNTVRDLAFNFYLQSYVGQDRSYLSQHLFTNFNFIQWTSAEEPLKLIWLVRDDGKLLSLTYLAEQEVYGWAQHDTQGLFRSVASVSEGTVDAVYVIVSRYVQPGADCGSGWYDFIERFDDRKFDCTEDVWFLDCAVANEKEFPAFTIYDSGPIGTVGGNVELCAAPSTNLYGGSGLSSPMGGVALDYVASSSAPLHYARGNFDFDNNRLYHEQAVAGGDPNTNGHSMFVFNLQTRAQIAGPLAPGEIAFASPGVTCVDYAGGILYGTSDGANLVGRCVVTDAGVATNTTFNATGVTGGLSAVGYVAQITDGTNQYVLATGLNSGQGVPAHSSPCFVVQMTGTIQAIAAGNPADITQPFQNYFDELPGGGIAPGNAFPIRGPRGAGFVLVVDPVGGVGTVQVGVYIMQLLADGKVWKTKIGAVVPTAVDAAWTSISLESAVYDETDGNIICLFLGSNANRYLTKISSNDASVIWKISVAPSVPFWQSRVRDGKMNFIDNAGSPWALKVIDTLAGTVLSTTAETVIGPNTFATDDATGQIVVQVNDIATTMWATFGPANPTAWATPGQVVQIGCGKVTVVTNDTPFELHGTVTSPLTNAIPNDPTGTVGTPVTDFSVATPTTTVRGLWHLEGKSVMAVADGLVVGPFTVTNGKITLQDAATNIVVGLLYQAQLQTLYLDAPGPNMQGKRKAIPAATIRLADSRGPKIGRTFDDLIEMQGLQVVGANPQPLVTGDFREVLFSDWETNGQLCVQQDYPLPLTVLGIIPEFVRGDTAN